MKKATNPLALDLRAGGFEVFPIAKLFDLPSNVWYPSILIRENLLAEESGRFRGVRFEGVRAGLGISALERKPRKRLDPREFPALMEERGWD